MAQVKDAPQLALLSIHPVYAHAILRGEKRVEFRKRPFRRDVDFVAIYATAPVQRVIGVFSVEAVQIESPRRIWKKFHSIGGISQEAFSSYYSGVSSAVAIQVGEVHALPEPVCLSRFDSITAPPQSFMYLCDKSREIILDGLVPLGGSANKPMQTDTAALRR